MPELHLSFPRVIFFDLDGTLLAPGSVLTERTARAVRRAADRGAVIVLSTGGFSYRALLLARRIDVGGPRRTWVVTHNGASVWDPGGTLVHHEAMPAAAMEGLLRASGPRVWCVYEAVRELPIGARATAGLGTSMYFAGRRRHDLAHFVWGPEPPQSAPDAGGPSSGVAPDILRGVSSRVTGGVLGCWCIGTPRALAPLDRVAEDGAFMGARYLPWAHRLALILGQPGLRLVGRDVGPLGTSKGTAAEWLCRRLGVGPQETAAFGDSLNDVEQLQLTGRAVVMANAYQSLFELADEVAPPCTEDGVAQVLERWLDLRDS
jgi:hydroxymethylpyrimidine pyrophosphatase-like HAD family hydrolase